MCYLLFFTLYYKDLTVRSLGSPGGASGKEPTCQCRRQKRHKFDPWVRKKPTPVFLPGEIPWTEKPGGLQSIGSQSQTRPK